MAAKTLIKRAKHVYLNKGMGALASISIYYIYELLLQAVSSVYRSTVRNIMPETRHAVYNGVQVPVDVDEKARLGDSLIPQLPPDKENYKNGYIKLLREWATKVDHVTIIGGGRGISAVVAAEHTSNVTVYEPSEEQVSMIKKTLVLNDVEGKCEVINSAVGSPLDVYNNEIDYNLTDPTNLDECGLLLLDCEGSEYEIIEDMKIRPDYLIVELHPHNVSHLSEKLINNVELSGYSITYQGKYYGEEISRAELKRLLNLRDNKQVDRDGSKVKNPIIGAKYK